MKKLFLILFFVIGAMSAEAQELKWHTDMKEAIKVSNKTKKPLFLFFTGSDWCGWCIRLQKEVFKTKEFAEWADKNVTLVELDFPRKTAQELSVKQQNAQLAQTFQVRGYPTVWFANATESKDGKINFTAMGSFWLPGGWPFEMA
jgi:thioredoxin-related protein